MKLEYENGELFLKNGWQFLARKRDQSDLEWFFWKSSILERIWMGFIGHIALGLTLRFFGLFEKRNLYFTCFSMIFLVCCLGPKVTFFYIMEILVINSIAWIFSSSLYVWITSMLFLFIMIAPPLRKKLVEKTFLYSSEDTNYYCQEYIFTMGLLRFTSSALYIVKYNKENKCNKESENISSYKIISLFCKKKVDSFYLSKNEIPPPLKKFMEWNMLDIICYNLYVPLVIAGPIMTFQSFFYQFKKPEKMLSGKEVFVIVKGFLKSVIWMFIIDIFSHFFYNHAFLCQPNLLNNVPLWSLAAIGYVTGQIFMVKYFALWSGLSSVVKFDHIETPRPPCCISRIYSYSQMWKLFDKGLYQFLKEHIYLPLGGHNRGKFNHILSVLATFSFIFLWHGASLKLIVWIIINIFALTLEECLHYIHRTPLFTRFDILYPNISQRLRTLFILPILGISTLGTFIFLGDLQTGWIIFYRILIGGFPSSHLLLLISGYSMVQTSKFFEKIYPD